MPEPTSRRERARKATLAEVHVAARKLLVTKGSNAVTINAVARELGMSGPALYHYFAGHEDLVGAVTAGFFEELAQAMAAARDERPGASLDQRLLATCRALRAWATHHPAEFGWIFATPIDKSNRATGSERHRAGQGFEQVLQDLIVELWETRGFEVPDPVTLPDSLMSQLRSYSDAIGGRLPPEAAHVFLDCWIRLYGLLCMEILHQLDFVLADLEPVFELCLRELASRLGLEYSEPDN
ncbi:TetR/AcrR family transcriptional regulator [Saccharomonospora sp. NPDC006951]